MLEIVRPFGLRRLIFVCAMLLVQAVSQLVAVFSVLPFLTAAADIQRFRSSVFGNALTHVLGGSNRDLLIQVGVGSLLLLIAGNGVTLLTEWIRGRYAHQIGHRIRTYLIECLLARNYEYFLSVNSSILIKNLVEDVITFTQNILIPSLDVLARIALSLLLSAALFIMEPVVSLCALIGTIAYYYIVIAPIRRAATRNSNEVKNVVRRLYFEISQTLSGIKPILATDRQVSFRDRCARASRSLASLIPNTLVYMAVPRIGLELLVFGGLITWVLLTLITGGALISIMPRVGIVAIIAYRLMPSLQLIVGQAMGIASSRQAMDEVLMLLRQQHEMSAGGAAAQEERHYMSWKGSVRFDQVGFRYAGAERTALQDISFTISKGEHVAFVGPTGSGKSTLVDLILGLLTPTSGQILIDEAPLTPENRPAWRSVIGYVPQDLFLLDGSIAENIAFGSERGKLNLDRVRAVALQAQATDFIVGKGAVDDSDSKFWAQVGERGLKLSGGQRQRLGLARALYEKPSILLLDEATSALDPQTESRVVDAVGREHDRLTIITVAHRLATVMNYDRIYFIQDGRISAIGTYAELIETHAPFRQFARV